MADMAEASTPIRSASSRWDRAVPSSRRRARNRLHGIPIRASNSSRPAPLWSMTRDIRASQTAAAVATFSCSHTTIVCIQPFGDQVRRGLDAVRDAVRRPARALGGLGHGFVRGVVRRRRPSHRARRPRRPLPLRRRAARRPPVRGRAQPRPGARRGRVADPPDRRPGRSRRAATDGRARAPGCAPVVDAFGAERDRRAGDDRARDACTTSRPSSTSSSSGSPTIAPEESDKGLAELIHFAAPARTSTTCPTR